MVFAALVFLITLSIASSAAFFSVFGLAHIYAASMIPIIIMGTSLEAGKLVAASFLYRFWDKISILLKIYLISAIFALMVITSMGIFGYLTAAHQKDMIPLKDQEQRISLYTEELNSLKLRKQEMDAQISDMPATYITAKQRLIDTFNSEYVVINPRIEFLTAEIQSISFEKINVEAKIGPIIYVAKALNKDPDDAILYFTLMLILVFDPLAIALTIATNIVIKSRESLTVAIDDAKKDSTDLDSMLSNMNTTLNALNDIAQKQQIKSSINKEIHQI